MNLFQLKNLLKRRQHIFLPQRRGEPVTPMLTEQLKSLQIDELKQILSAISQERDARQVPNRSPSKPENVSLTQAHEASSI